MKLKEGENMKIEKAKMNNSFSLEDLRKAFQMNTFRQELIDLYMQGWLDRDWRIGRDKADEKAEMYADQIMKKYKL